MTGTEGPSGADEAHDTTGDANGAPGGGGNAQPGRGPVGQLVDLCVYAPLGLALDARALLPELVDRGRSQVGMARMVGEFAVKWGSTRAEAAVGEAQDKALGLLRATGLAPVDDRDRTASATGSSADATPADATAPAADATASDATASDAGPTGDEGSDQEDPTEPAVDVDDLAIPDYDNLSASQVVPRLDGLTADELDAVGRYERAGRRRNTILGKVAQLQDPTAG